MKYPTPKTGCQRWVHQTTRSTVTLNTPEQVVSKRIPRPQRSWRTRWSSPVIHIYGRTARGRPLEVRVERVEFARRRALEAVSDWLPELSARSVDAIERRGTPVPDVKAAVAPDAGEGVEAGVRHRCQLPESKPNAQAEPPWVVR